ncbi:hypothetical protein GMW39_06800 [Pectobacterium parmentieri]|uniref:hypothetical protein n=1 Tax=Pectobacterium parmentieri TaxID=1905730 RepID=UPI0013743DF4|nr:hypothetical protein [Pectobacterium parmentieri]QHQ15597.1 hypothetical protein GMW39_06800 [Pectobacterium parmentieri]
MAVKNMSRLEQYRVRQAERIEAMSRAIDEGRTTVVASRSPSLKIIRCVVAGGFFIGTPYSSKTRFWAVRSWPQATI